MILVIGATGELGSMVVRKLANQKTAVRAFARHDSAINHLNYDGVEVAFGDLRDLESVNEACRGIDAVIATANTVVPRKRGYSFERDEAQGYQNLIRACQSQGVKQIVLISVPVTPVDEEMPTYRYKRFIEQQLQKSGTAYTIFRGSLFMDDWLALFGSRMLLRGTTAATLNRPFWLAQMYLKLVGNLIAGHGLALLPGNGMTRQAFITKENVAEFLVRAIHHPQAQNQVFNLGGPEILSLNEAIQIFGGVLGRTVRPLHAPAGMFRVMCKALMPLSPAAANLMGMNWSVAQFDTLYEMDQVAPVFGVELTRMEEFLQKKVNLIREMDAQALASTIA